MASRPQILVTSESDLQDIIDDKRRLREETQRLARELGVETRELKEVERELARNVRANERAQRAQERMRREGIEANVRAMERSRTAAATWAGSWVNDIGDVVEAAIALGPAGGVALAALAGIAGAAIGVGATVAAMYELAYAADEAGDRLKALPVELRPLVNVTKEQQEVVSALDQSWAEVSAQMDAAAYEMGAQVAPAVVTVNKTLANMIEISRGGIVGLQEFGENALYWMEEFDVATGSATRQQVTLQRVARATLFAEGLSRAQAAQQAADRLAVEESLAKVLERQGKAVERSAAAQLKASNREADRLRSAIERQEEEERRGVEASLDKELDAFFRSEAEKVKIMERTKTERAKALKEEQRAAELAAAAELERLHMHQDAALAGVSAASSLAQALSDNADVVIAAKTAEALAYQAVAMARALAEGGIVAGVGAAFGFAGIIAGAIAEARAAPRHMGGSMAPDEGIFRVRDGEAFQAVPESDPRRTSQQAQAVTVNVQLDDRVFSQGEQRADRQDALWGNRQRRSAA